MPIFGEVRDFATGVIEAYECRPGLGSVRMQSVQRIWNGEKWCEPGSEEASIALAEILRERPEPFPSKSWHGG